MRKLCSFAIFFIATAFAPLMAQSLQVDELAEIESQAEGFASGAFYEIFADSPRIDAQGNVSFAAGIRTGPEFTDRAQAIYRHSDQLELVFAQGDPAPGTEGNFVQFPGIPITPFIEAGQLTFVATFTEPAAQFGPFGLWTDRSGNFDLLLRSGETLPGLAGGATVSNLAFGVEQGTVLINAISTGTPSTQGIWRNRLDNWEAVLVEGQAAPGLGNGVVFGPDPLTAFGPIFAWRIHSGGRALVQAWVTGPGIDEDNDEAFWRESASGLEILVREGQVVDLPAEFATAPGKRGSTATFGPTLSSPTFGSDGENATPSINDLGRAVFGAVLRSKGGRLNSVWTDRSGEAVLLATGGVPIEGFAQGSQAPGFSSGVGFALFSVSLINNQGDIALLGAADEHGSVFDLTRALWWDADGSLTLVAAAGRPAPGIAAGHLAEIQLEELTDHGALYWSGRLEGAGIDFSNDGVAFRTESGGSDEVLIRDGQSIIVVDRAGGSETRTVTDFEFGRGVAADGRRVVQIQFSDGTSGLYRTSLDSPPCEISEFPEASCDDGLDNDCDGFTDAADTQDCPAACQPSEPDGEISCGDLQDNDCDGLIDTDDPDCPVVCLARGSSCEQDVQCCSGKCRGPAGGKLCR